MATYIILGEICLGTIEADNHEAAIELAHARWPDTRFEGFFAKQNLETQAPAEPAQTASPAPSETAVERPSVPVPTAPPTLPVVVLSQHVELSPGIEIPVDCSRQLMTAEGDLQLIEARCRLKVEAARWAGARQRSVRDGAEYQTEIAPRDREIISKAKALDGCFLWMSHSSAPVPSDLRLWDDVAGCFEAAAIAGASCGNWSRTGGDRGFLEKAIDLTAEAQSALRIAIGKIVATADNDQRAIFTWLRQQAAELQVFVPRYMTLDDPADPTRWNDLQDRIRHLDSEIDAIRNRQRQRVDLLTTAQYHARNIREGKGSAKDWREVVDLVDSLVTEGLPASNTDLRKMSGAGYCRSHPRGATSRWFPASPGPSGSVLGDV